MSLSIAQPLALPTRRVRAPRPWPIHLVVQLATRKPLGFFGFLIVAVSVILAIFADVIAPYGYETPDFGATLQSPNPAHIMGTDFLGRDLFSRLVHGARVTIVVIIGAVGLGTVISSVLGVCSGYFGGRVDAIVQRFVDAWMSIPPVLFFLFIMAIIGPSVQNMIFVLGLLAIRESRVVRASVLSVREHTYVEAAQVAGHLAGRVLEPDRVWLERAGRCPARSAGPSPAGNRRAGALICRCQKRLVAAHSCAPPQKGRRSKDG